MAALAERLVGGAGPAELLAVSTVTTPQSPGSTGKLRALPVVTWESGLSGQSLLWERPCWSWGPGQGLSPPRGESYNYTSCVLGAMKMATLGPNMEETRRNNRPQKRRECEEMHLVTQDALPGAYSTTLARCSL